MNYWDEDVLKYTKEAFAESVALKVRHLRRYVKKGSNAALTGVFVEELVRGFIQDWIGHRRLINGTFYSSAFEKSQAIPLQIDGIVYDPTLGPMVINEGNFGIVHPAFCSSVIEIKTSYSDNLLRFQERLRKIHSLYLSNLSKVQVMGVVIADPDPERKSMITNKQGESFNAYSYRLGDWCPIFVLFKEEDFEYEPFEPAIDAMIRAVYTNQWNSANYL